MLHMKCVGRVVIKIYWIRAGMKGRRGEDCQDLGRVDQKGIFGVTGEGWINYDERMNGQALCGGASSYPPL